MLWEGDDDNYYCLVVALCIMLVSCQFRFKELCAVVANHGAAPVVV
jgi:hypothetical protein